MAPLKKYSNKNADLPTVLMPSKKKKKKKLANESQLAAESVIFNKLSS